MLKKSQSMVKTVWRPTSLHSPRGCTDRYCSHKKHLSQTGSLYYSLFSNLCHKTKYNQKNMGLLYLLPIMQLYMRSQDSTAQQFQLKDNIEANCLDLNPTGKLFTLYFCVQGRYQGYLAHWVHVRIK